MHILPRTFYDKDTAEVARLLIGKKLIRTIGSHQLTGIIAETEAYLSDNTYRVVKVIDGDTITINYDSKNESVRFIGINTPELKNAKTGLPDCYAFEAKPRERNVWGDSRLPEGGHPRGCFLQTEGPGW